MKVASEVSRRLEPDRDPLTRVENAVLMAAFVGFELWNKTNPWELEIPLSAE